MAKQERLAKSCAMQDMVDAKVANVTLACDENFKIKEMEDEMYYDYLPGIGYLNLVEEEEVVW